MKLDQEVRHKSEDIDDDVLLDVVKGLRRRVRVNRAYDIPYIAGYSVDGRTVFIDRHLPRTSGAGPVSAPGCWLRTESLRLPPAKAYGAQYRLEFPPRLQNHLKLRATLRRNADCGMF
jgi:hypothetical protein